MLGTGSAGLDGDDIANGAARDQRLGLGEGRMRGA